MRNVKSNSNNAGFSILEVVIASSIMSVLGMALATTIFNQSKSIVSLESKLESIDVKRELENYLQNVSNCDKAFRKSNDIVKYNPTNSSTYYKTVDELRIGGKAFIKKGKVTGYNKVSISRMRLITKNIPSVPTTIEVSGISTPATLHYVDFSIDLKNKVNDLMYNKRVPMRIYTRNSDNKIMQCQNEPKASFITATMKRSMIAIQRKFCLNSVGDRYFKDNTSYCPDHNGDGEQDSNGDGLCDAYANLDKMNWRALNRHPWSNATHKNNHIWQNYFPARKVAKVGPNLLNQQEGRCRAQAIKNDSGEAYKNIFKLYNKTGSFVMGGSGQHEGIGCNANKGWRVLNCTIGNYGISGDSDLSIKRINGHDYCVTNDHMQPHERYIKGGAWSMAQVSITTTCYKLTD